VFENGHRDFVLSEHKFVLDYLKNTNLCRISEFSTKMQKFYINLCRWTYFSNYPTQTFLSDNTKSLWPFSNTNFLRVYFIHNTRLFYCTEKRNRLRHTIFFCAPSDRKRLTVMIWKLDSTGSFTCYNRSRTFLMQLIRQSILCSSRSILIIWFKYLGFIVLRRNIVV
jgi:hypothetical protein